MTKYVLNSGGMSNNPEGARRFIQELVKDKGVKPKILFVFFAQPRELWESKLPEYSAAFNGLMPSGVKPEYEIAFPDKLKDQIKRSDVIYCHGGDDDLATYWFKRTSIAKLWNNKTVGTNSATTHVLSKFFWTCDWREIKEGLGILNIKTIAHYKSNYGNYDPRGPIDWRVAEKELENYGDKTLPIYALAEGEFVVFKK